MAFPDTPAALKVELQLAGTWTDITTYVRVQEKIKLRRGRSSEGQNVDPASCTLTLDNRDGRFSLRNPTSPYYGQLTRNTPLRVSVSDLDNVSLQTTPPTSSRATTPHAAAQNVGVGGDLDVRVDLVPYDLYGSAADLVGKWDPTGSQASYLLWIDADGFPWLSWTTGGTSGTQRDRRATVAVPRDNFRRFAVRGVLDTDNGAAGHTVTFYYADDIASTWRQLGDPVVTAGTTSVFTGTAQLSIARATSSGSLVAMTGRVYGAQVRVGAGAATLAASPDFTAATAGAGTYTDAQGNVWTPSATAAFSSGNVRFVGEVSQWPVEWEYSGREVAAPIVASSVLRRLQANVPPLRSTLRRSIPSLPAIRAYWPSEDDSGATQLAYGLADPIGQYAAFISGTPSLGSGTAFNASEALPTWTQGSYARGQVPPYTATTKAQVRCVMQLPASGFPANGTLLLQVRTSSATWYLKYNASPNNLLWQATEDGGAAFGLANTFLAAALDGKASRISVELTQNGANIDWTVAYLYVGASVGIAFTGTALGVNLGIVKSVQWGGAGGNASIVTGHVSVESDVTSLFALATQLNAYTTEAAGVRAKRLATEEGYTLYRQGGTSSTAMGPQLPDSLINLLRQAADSELGTFYDMRGVSGLAFHNRATLFAREAAVPLVYGTHLTDFQPVDDDQALTNNVVLSRQLGSSYEVSQASGPLSVQAPPSGVGKYTASATVSLASDSQLREQANYRLALGTIDSPRYPQVGLQLNRPGFYGSAGARELARKVLDADLGDVLQVTGVPGFYAPATVWQRIEGVTEVISEGGRRWEVSYNTSPGELWRNTGVWSDPTGRTRWDATASALAAGVTSSATALSVSSSAGELWTTTPAHFPFDIMVAGEQMTVTNIVGASSPQAFTVTRSVNGVVKAQLAAAPVHVYPLAYYGF